MKKKERKNLGWPTTPFETRGGRSHPMAPGVARPPPRAKKIYKNTFFFFALGGGQTIPMAQLQWPATHCFLSFIFIFIFFLKIKYYFINNFQWDTWRFVDRWIKMNGHDYNMRFSYFLSNLKGSGSKVSPLSPRIDVRMKRPTLLSCSHCDQLE